MFAPKQHEGNIKLNFQPGITRQYIQYLWGFDWTTEHLSDIENELNDAIDASSIGIRFCDADRVTDLVTELEAVKTKHLVVVENATAEDITFVHKTYAESPNLCFLILGDVSALLSLSKSDAISGLNKKIVHLGVTRFDRERDGPYNSDKTDKENSDMSPLEVWQIDKRVRKIFRKLYVWSVRSYALKETWRIKNVPLKYLAPACGFWLIRTSVVYSTDGSIVSDYDANTTSLLCMPSSLQGLYQLDCLEGFTLPSGDEELWKFMQEIVAKNIATSNHHGIAVQTYGQRFEFLRTSFVADLQHKVNQVLLGPKMDLNSGVYDFTRARNFTNRKIFNLARLHTKNWPDLLRAMDDTHVVRTRNVSHGPDVFAKLRNDSDPSNPVHHLLCFQVQHGEQDLSFWEVLDELAKCPFVTTEEKRYGHRKLSFKNVHEDNDSTTITYKLTFVYVAITHANACEKIRLKKCFIDSKDDYVRCINGEKCPYIPENVELIILKKKGIVELLGRELYEHLKISAPSSNDKTAQENVRTVPEATPKFKDSRSKATVEEEMSDFVAKSQVWKKLVLVPKDPNELFVSSFDSNNSLTINSTQSSDGPPTHRIRHQHKGSDKNTSKSSDSSDPSIRSASSPGSLTGNHNANIKRPANKKGPGKGRGDGINPTGSTAQVMQPKRGHSAITVILPTNANNQLRRARTNAMNKPKKTPTYTPKTKPKESRNQIGLPDILWI